MHAHAQRPGGSPASLPPVSLKGIVLSRQTGCSFLQLLQQQMGNLGCAIFPSRASVSSPAMATQAPRAGVRMGVIRECPRHVPLSLMRITPGHTERWAR